MTVNLSIRHKLTIMMMALNIAALLAASAAFIAYDIHSFRSTLIAELYTLAEIIGNNSSAAIEFDDEQSAKEILSALRAKTHIVSAALFKTDGTRIAGYSRDTAQNNVKPDMPVMKAEGYHFSSGRLSLTRDVFLKNKKIGAVGIESDLGEIYTRLKYNLIVVAVIILVISTGVFLAAYLLQRSISDPILKLARTTQDVSKTQNYSVQVLKQSEDEIGQLYDGFNLMMKQVQSRDLALRQAGNELEQRVQKRTEELQKAYDELKLVQSQLIQSEKMASIGQLAAGVAHEINNPVGFIGNNMELLGQYVGDYIKILKMFDVLKISVVEGNMEKAKSIAKDIDRFMKDIQLDYVMDDTGKLLAHNQKGIERIHKIVMDLKTFSYEGKEVMDLLKIEEIIDSVISIVHNELKYKAELTKEYGKTPQVRCNLQRIGQVIINLLVNATQAIENRGTIKIRTYCEGEYVCVDVSDNGQGIKEDHLKRIFDPFFTTKPIGKGTGLGLSVSHEIIKKHHGEIRVRSKEGEGTTFTVMLPAAVSSPVF
jgi:signal transduction histidine kinase